MLLSYKEVNKHEFTQFKLDLKPNTKESFCLKKIIKYMKIMTAMFL